MSFGGDTSASTSGTRESEKVTEKASGTERSQLKLDQKAISKIIEDVLGGTEGLASIFAGENTAGVFDSTVAAQASGDLVANLVGELAKITGETVTTRESEAERRRNAKSRTNEFEAIAEGKFGF